MKKLLQIIAIIIIFIIAVLYFLDGLEYTEAEREWCKKHRPLLPIEICAKEFGYWDMKKRAIIKIDYNIPNGTIEEIAKKHELLSRFLKVFGEMDEQIVNKSMKIIDVNDEEITNITQLKFQ